MRRGCACLPNASCIFHLRLHYRRIEDLIKHEFEKCTRTCAKALQYESHLQHDAIAAAPCCGHSSDLQLQYTSSRTELSTAKTAICSTQHPAPSISLRFVGRSVADHPSTNADAMDDATQQRSSWQGCVPHQAYSDGVARLGGDVAGLGSTPALICPVPCPGILNHPLQTCQHTGIHAHSTTHALAVVHNTVHMSVVYVLIHF